MLVKTVDNYNWQYPNYYIYLLKRRKRESVCVPWATPTHILWSLFNSASIHPSTRVSKSVLTAVCLSVCPGNCVRRLATLFGLRPYPILVAPKCCSVMLCPGCRKNLSPYNWSEREKEREEKCHHHYMSSRRRNSRKKRQELRVTER